MRMGPSLFDSKTTAAQLDAIAIQELGKVIKEEKIPLTSLERDQLVAAITDQVLGYGPIERYLADPAVSEIMVNGLDGIYVERNGKITLTDSYFLSDQHILRVIDRIVAPIGRRIDELSPMVDARLADGSRVNAIIPPARGGWAGSHDSEVRTAHLHRRRPGANRSHVGPARRLPQRVRRRTGQHPRERWYGQRQDHAAQRAVGDDPRGRADRDHRRQRRAAPVAATRRASRRTSAEHRGSGRNSRQRSLAQRAANAPGPDHHR